MSPLINTIEFNSRKDKVDIGPIWTQNIEPPPSLIAHSDINDSAIQRSHTKINNGFWFRYKSMIMNLLTPD